MAGIKISDLPADTTPVLADIIPLVHAGVTDKATLQQILTLILSNLNAGTPLTNGQLIIGSTGFPATGSTLTAGSNISIVNSAGGIAIAVSVPLSSNTGTGAFVGSVAPAISQPNLIGVTGATNAAAGSIGQFITGVVLDGAPTVMVSSTPTDMTSIVLTGGDWDVWGNLVFPTLGTTPTKIIGWVSSTSATLPDASLQSLSYIAGAPDYVSVSIPTRRFSLAAGNTTIYISGSLVNTSGNGSGIGFISARRIR